MDVKRFMGRLYARVVERVNLNPRQIASLPRPAEGNGRPGPAKDKVT